MRGVITDEECEYIKTVSKEKLKPSTVGDDFTEDHDIRKSETAWLDRDDPVIKRVITRCVDDTSVCERLQVVRYTPGGFYKPHQDANIEHSNRRKHTFIFALNDEYEGGETIFPNLNMSFKLKKRVTYFNLIHLIAGVEFHIKRYTVAHQYQMVKSGSPTYGSTSPATRNFSRFAIWSASTSALFCPT